jgi:HTH-type transcriptional regulator / antitoxin HigA
MYHIKLIKNDQDHAAALARVSELMDQDFISGSETADELEVLALLIERYEQEHFPMENPDPIEAIKFRMEQQGLLKKDLVPFIGSASKVTEVLNGTRQLSLNMIRNIAAGLNISVDILIRMPSVKTKLTAKKKSQKNPIQKLTAA